MLVGSKIYYSGKPVFFSTRFEGIKLADADDLMIQTVKKGCHAIERRVCSNRMRGKSKTRWIDYKSTRRKCN